MKLDNIITVRADLICETGLHVGASDAEMHIGGVDNSVMKNPVTGEPFIPGSSLKGKMRSLLEWRSGLVEETPLSWKTYKATKDEEALRILKLFGLAASDRPNVDEARFVGPTRLSFWDAVLDPDWSREYYERHRIWTEVKTENMINRITASASDSK